MKILLLVAAALAFSSIVHIREKQLTTSPTYSQFVQ